MDEQRVDAAVAGVQGGAFEQASTETPATRRLQDRDAEFRHGRMSVPLWRRGIGQMGHRDQRQFAVEDAEHLVTIKVDRQRVTLDLLVGSRIAETQITVMFIQAQQMLGDTVPVSLGQRANRDPGGDPFQR